MRRALLKTAFHIAELLLLLILMIPVLIIFRVFLEVVVPARPDAHGHYHSTGVWLLFLILPLLVGGFAATWLASFLFRSAGVSEDELQRIRRLRRRR
jgi:hypothetical protein